MWWRQWFFFSGSKPSPSNLSPYLFGQDSAWCEKNVILPPTTTFHLVSNLYFFVHDYSNLLIRSLEMGRPVAVQTPLAYSGLEMLHHMN